MSKNTRFAFAKINEREGEGKMKYALDTNTLITICKNTAYIKNLITFLDSGNQVFVHQKVLEEFTEKASEAEVKNFNQLSNKINIETRRWFTIGASVIGGQDMIARESFSAFEKDYDENKYEEHLENSSKSKTESEYVQKIQSDPTIFSWAVENNCNYFVTNNLKDFRKVVDNYHIMLMKNDDLMKLMSGKVRVK